MGLEPTPDSIPATRLTKMGRGRSWMPFWLLQVAELVVAVVFVDASIHVSNAGLLVVAAFLFFALAITARGPLGIFRLCSQHLHVLLTLLTGVVVAIAPILPVFRPDIEGIVVVEFGAIGLIRLCTLTQTGAQTQARRLPVIDATASVSGRGPLAPPPSPAPAPAPAPAPSQGGASRRAGRAAGSVAASGTWVAARYGPEARAQVKRSIKGVGRVAGRVKGATEGTEGPPS